MGANSPYFFCFSNFFLYLCIMKQLEIPFVYVKTENKSIFGGSDTLDSRSWITLDDANSLNKKTKHILVFNTKTKYLYTDGLNTRFIIDDTTSIKPSIKEYMILERCLRKKGYRFNKKLSTIEKIPY